MRESCTYGSVRGVLSNEHPYRNRPDNANPIIQRRVAEPRGPYGRYPRPIQAEQLLYYCSNRPIETGRLLRVHPGV